MSNLVNNWIVKYFKQFRKFMVFHFSCLIVSICNQQFLFISCFFVINNSVFFVFSVTRKENVLGAKELMRQIIHKLWLKRHHFWHRYKAQNVFFSILFFYIHSTIYSNPVKRNRFKDIIFLNSSEFQIPIFLCNFVLKQQNIHHQYLDYRCSTFHFINLHHS